MKTKIKTTLENVIKLENELIQEITKNNLTNREISITLTNVKRAKQANSLITKILKHYDNKDEENAMGNTESNDNSRSISDNNIAKRMPNKP